MKHAGHPFRGVTLHAFGEVAVNVFGDRDGRVAKNLRHHLKRGALSQHDAGCRMTCLMRVPVSQTGLLAQPHERLGEIVRVDRSPHQRREDQPIIDPQIPGRASVLILAPSMKVERFERFVGQEQHPPAAACLELSQLNAALHPAKVGALPLSR